MDKPDSGVPWWLSAWLAPGAGAPQQLSQPILPGWSLFSVTNQNSSQPDTEREIVAAESYGRQIGKLTDAVLALIAERPEGSPALKPFADLAALDARIDRIKCDAAEQRIARLRDDLEALRLAKPEAYARQVAELRAILGEAG